MADIPFKFEAFSFNGICETVALPLCPMMGEHEGIEPVCYSRNVDLGGNLVFQPGIAHMVMMMKLLDLSVFVPLQPRWLSMLLLLS